MAILLERDQIGKREDLADFLAIADMKGTPITSTMAKGRELVNSSFEWVAEGFKAPTLASHVDGTDLQLADHDNQAASRKILEGRVHYFIEEFGVSYLANNLSDVAGVGKRNEFAHNASKALTVIKRAMEVVVGADIESAPDDGSQTGYTMRGLGKWLQNGAQSDKPVDALYRTPADQIYTGTFADFDEDDLQDLLQAQFQQTGESDKNFSMVCGSQLRRKITSFANYDPGISSTVATLRMFNQDATGKKIVNTIDIFEGDFGTVELQPSVWLAYDSQDSDVQQQRGYILDMANIELRYNQMPEMNELEDRGAGPRGFWRAIAGMCVKNPLQHCKIDPQNN